MTLIQCYNDIESTSIGHYQINVIITLNQRYNNVDSMLLQNSIIRLISNIESTSLQNLFFAAISNQHYNNVDSMLLQNLTIITFFDLKQCGI